MGCPPALAIVLALCATSRADRDHDRDLCPTALGEKYGQPEKPSPVRPRDRVLKRLEGELPAGWRLRTLSGSLLVVGHEGTIIYPIGPSWTRASAVFDRAVAEADRRAKRERAVLPTIDSVHDAPSSGLPMLPPKPRCELGKLSVYEPHTEGTVAAEDEHRIHRLVDRHCKRVSRGK
jgi:hypothetical protein